MIPQEEIARIASIRKALSSRHATQEDINYILCIKRKAKAIQQECNDVLDIIKGEAE